jgi:hypothetical protein
MSAPVRACAGFTTLKTITAIGAAPVGDNFIGRQWVGLRRRVTMRRYFGALAVFLGCVLFEEAFTNRSKQVRRSGLPNTADGENKFAIKR